MSQAKLNEAVKVEHINNIDDEKLELLSVKNWPIWTKEASEFDWHYDEEETCYLLEGDVTVSWTDRSGSKCSVDFVAGDLVVFQKGLSCYWNIKKAVKKHYKFG